MGIQLQPLLSRRSGQAFLAKHAGLHQEDLESCRIKLKDLKEAMYRCGAALGGCHIWAPGSPGNNKDTSGKPWINMWSLLLVRMWKMDEDGGTWMNMDEYGGILHGHAG